jgi:hypothetical protein
MDVNERTRIRTSMHDRIQDEKIRKLYESFDAIQGTEHLRLDQNLIEILMEEGYIYRDNRGKYRVLEGYSGLYDELHAIAETYRTSNEEAFTAALRDWEARHPESTPTKRIEGQSKQNVKYVHFEMDEQVMEAMIRFIEKLIGIGIDKNTMISEYLQNDEKFNLIVSKVQEKFKDDPVDPRAVAFALEKILIKLRGK